MFFKLDGTELNLAAGSKWIDAYRLLPEDRKTQSPLGISVKGKTYALNEEVIEYAYAKVLSFGDEEGRRIYERSLMLLFLNAAYRVVPELGLRIEHSFGEGIYVSPEGGAKLSEETVARIEEEMHALCRQDLPLVHLRVTTKYAREYFEQTGQTERLRLLNFREFPHFNLYRIGDGPEDYYYGDMVPSTIYINAFSLVPYHGGVVVMQPDPKAPTRPASFKDMPKLFTIYKESAGWNRILGCQNAADLNDMVSGRQLREFIRVSEVLHERKIAQIADAIADSGARIILVAGPSSSGKTTFSHRLSIALRVLGLRPVKVSLDDYYIDRDKLPVLEDGSVDLETIDALDTALISAHLRSLLAGEAIEMPTYDFQTGKRMEKTHTFSVEPGQPIIIEGIHGLNDRLTEGIDRSMKFKVYISALTMLNLDDHNRIRTHDARLLRRIVRDHQFRGTLPEETIARWASVQRGEEKYIFPYQEEADAMFNSSLPYELCIMKKYAYPSLMAIQPESPHYTLARRLVKFLHYIRTADVEDEIPVNSLLREFIGGSCFYRETD